MIRPHELWGISSYLSTATATFVGRYARELFRCCSWLSKSSLTLLFIKFSIWCIYHKSITYIHTDGRTDGRTDTLSYRDARMHLKKWNPEKFELLANPVGAELAILLWRVSVSVSLSLSLSLSLWSLVGLALTRGDHWSRVLSYPELSHIVLVRDDDGKIASAARRTRSRPRYSPSGRRQIERGDTWRL